MIAFYVRQRHEMNWRPFVWPAEVYVSYQDLVKTPTQFVQISTTDIRLWNISFHFEGHLDHDFMSQGQAPADITILWLLLSLSELWRYLRLS